MILDRTVRRVRPDGREGKVRPLASYRSAPAYVLLGDPGAGKTTAFRREADDSSGEALFLGARDFLALEPAPRPEWRDRTLLLDGLDEVRAGSADARTPFDAIRSRLDRLGRPRFRISCREADWLGANDRERLELVSPDGEVVVLRLEPLSGEEAARLVSGRPQIGDPAAFLRNAQDRGLEGLLRNPQSLELLAKVFGETGDWPASRLDTFERASVLQVQEHNEEHRIGGPDIPAERIVEAAGHLAAVQLLSGKAGHSLAPGDAADGFIPLSIHPREWHESIRAALRTRLFAAVGDRQFAPVHAHIAAFLAARYLARLIGTRVSARRVLALLAGEDGAPPTPLRDLAAWLAALSPELRPQLMERDPVAVLRYGDIANLPTGDKRELLGNLAHDPWRLHRSKWPESALRGLAGPDMKTVLQERLREGDRSPAAQMLVVIVAKTLNHSPVAAELAPDLLAVVRDPIRPSTIRQAALDAWVHALRKHPDRVPRLRHLLMELRERRIPDGQGELMAALLEALYPASIGPSEIWDCLRPGSGPVSYRCFRFWKSVGETCPDDHLPGHLDRLSQTIERFRARVRTRRLWNLPLHLLARAVWIHGSQVEPLQLIRWLQVGLDAHGTLGSFGGELPKEARRVAAWLEANPRIQKAVIRAALRTEEFRESESAAFELDELLYRSRLPDDIGHWHLGEAVSTRGAHLAEPHLTGFLAALAKEPVDVDRELADARSALKDRPAALRYLETHLSSRLPEDYFQQKIRRRHLRPRHPRTETRLLDATRSAEEDLVGNRASPRLLQRLAERCYQDSLRGPSDLRPSLREALGGDARLEKAVRKGLRNTIEREDLPSAGHLLRLRRQGRQSVFVGPVLVGLADREPAETASLSDERLRAALTFRLLGGALATKAAWYGRCLRERPDLVAETLVSAGRVLLKSGETSIPDVLELAQDDQYATVARRATLPLLRSFPARAREAQLSLLDALLRSGLRYLRNDRDRSAFERVIARKAAQPSTTRIGRVHWLAAGLLLNPDRFEPSLSEEVSDSDSRARSFSGFFESLVDVPQWFAESLVLPTLEFLVRTLGRSADPIMTMAKITPVDPVSVVISHLIVRLSHCPEQGATEALTRLASDTGLAKWRQELESGLDAQRVIRRDASYRPPEPAQLIRALRDGPPASAADLRELVVDRLKTIDTQLRTTDANPWQMFWNQDRYGRPTEPKPETACRDALLDLLRSKLPEECRAHPERHFAAGKRADITVSFGDFRVPVEVKKNSHRSLWRAVRNQLLPRSTNDPATEGLGIYLVLWLQPERTAPAPEGRRPASAAQLRKRLVESLSPEERRRAAVVVMDATPP